MENKKVTRLKQLCSRLLLLSKVMDKIGAEAFLKDEKLHTELGNISKEIDQIKNGNL